VPGEQGAATLKSWRILRKVRCSPSRADGPAADRTEDYVFAACKGFWPRR
jgi:hypothetical protein